MAPLGPDCVSMDTKHPSISLKRFSLIASSNENIAFLLEIYKMTSSIDMHCRTVVENIVLSKIEASSFPSQ